MKIKLILAAALCVFVMASCGNNSGAKAGTEQAAAEGTCCSSTGEGCQKPESMIKIITAYKFIKPEKVDEFIEFTKPIIEKSNAEPGCISYTLYQNPSDPTKFIFYEEWQDQAAIDYHFSTEHFELAGSRSDFEAAPTILNIYDAAKAN